MYLNFSFRRDLPLDWFAAVYYTRVNLISFEMRKHIFIAISSNRYNTMIIEFLWPVLVTPI